MRPGFRGRLRPLLPLVVYGLDLLLKGVCGGQYVGQRLVHHLQVPVHGGLIRVKRRRRPTLIVVDQFVGQRHQERLVYVQLAAVSAVGFPVDVLPHQESAPGRLPCAHLVRRKIKHFRRHASHGVQPRRIGNHVVHVRRPFEVLVPIRSGPLIVVYKLGLSQGAFVPRLDVGQVYPGAYDCAPSGARHFRIPSRRRSPQARTGCRAAVPQHPPSPGLNTAPARFGRCVGPFICP